MFRGRAKLTRSQALGIIRNDGVYGVNSLNTHYNIIVIDETGSGIIGRMVRVRDCFLAIGCDYLNGSISNGSICLQSPEWILVTE